MKLTDWLPNVVSSIRNKFFVVIVSILSIILVSCSNNESSSKSSEEGNSEKKVRWKMASTFPGSLTQLGTSGVRFQDQI